MTQWTSENWEKRFKIIYKSQVSSLYHRKRERYYSLLDKATSTFALIAGASAMTEVLPTTSLKALAGAVVAAITLPGIVFSWADKARLHALLAAKFISLEAEIEGAGILNVSQLNKFQERVLKLEIEEPPQLSALTRMCQNEIAYAMNEQTSMTKLTFLERKLAHFLDMPISSMSPDVKQVKQ